MSGSSPAGYTTSTQNVTPSGNAVNYQNSGLDFGKNIYNAGPTYAGLNGDQTSGLNEIARIANSGNQTANQFYDLAQGFTGGQYLNSNIANPGLQSIAGNNMNTQGFQNNLTALGAAANGQNPDVGYLTDVMQGKYLDPSTNPWLKNTFDQGFQGIQNNVNNAMAGAGRFGSGAMAGSLGSAATNLANTLYGTQYQNERQLQQQAAGTLGSQYQTGVGLGISANTDAGQLASGDRSAVLGALQQLGGNYNAGLDATTKMAALSPTLNEARYADMGHLLQAGAGFQQDANAWAQEPWQRLNNYMNVSRGLPTSTTTTTSNPYFSNSTGNALTGALGGASLLNTLFGGSGKDGSGPSLAGNLGSGAMSLYNKLFGGSGSSGGGGGGTSGAGSIGANSQGQFTMSNGQVAPAAVGYGYGALDYQDPATDYSSYWTPPSTSYLG